ARRQRARPSRRPGHHRRPADRAAETALAPSSCTTSRSVVARKWYRNPAVCQASSSWGPRPCDGDVDPVGQTKGRGVKRVLHPAATARSGVLLAATAAAAVAASAITPPVASASGAPPGSDGGATEAVEEFSVGVALGGPRNDQAAYQAVFEGARA